MPITGQLLPGVKDIVIPSYSVANSCRFAGDDTDHYLTRTLSTNGNKKIWTCSAWVKRTQLTRTQVIFFAGNNGQDSYPMYIRSDDRINSVYYEGGFTYRLETNAVFRDVSAWYHIVVAFDSTQSTASNRVKIYVNGSQITSLATASYPSLNAEYSWNNSSYNHNIGFQTTHNDFDLGAYLAEVVHIDGQALDPTSFGEFDSASPNIWKPIDVSGLTFGTNGFYLDFENASSLGADVSGQSNNFTVNNLATVDQSTDTCTNNFCVLNNLVPTATMTYGESNLALSGYTAYTSAYGTIGFSSGKWYWEMKVKTNSMSGVSATVNGSNYPGQASDSYAFDFTNGQKYNNNSASSFGSSAVSDGDTVGVAFDANNGELHYYNNSGSLIGTAFTGIDTSKTYFPIFRNGNSANIEVNFGSPIYTESGGNSDGNGYGNFKHSVPSGYYCINTKNLAEFG